MSEAAITHRVLDAIAEAHRSGAMLFGSDEHDAFVELAILHVPELVKIARDVLPGETLAEVHIPGFLPRGSQNVREHHMVRSRRVAKEHQVVALALLAGARQLKGKGAIVGRVVIRRNSPRLLDSDNCVGSLKAVRDAVAKFLGIDDGARGISWNVGQDKVSRAAQGVVIRVEERR